MQDIKASDRPTGGSVAPALAGLLDGYRRFRSGVYQEREQVYRRLAEAGQAPKVMVIGCADSRADPALIFDAGPGELFVVRNVANLVPPFELAGHRHGTSSALEFAVNSLHVETILVLGHGRCGGIQAFMQSLHEPEAGGQFIGKWMSILEAARAEVLKDYADAPEAERMLAMERAAVGASLDNLMSFDFVREAVAAGRLSLQGGWFDISEGVLYLRDPGSGAFRPLPDAAAAATGDGDG